MNNPLKHKPAKHLSLFSKIAGFLFFITNYELRIFFTFASGDYQLPGVNETLGLIYASVFISQIFITVDLSIIIQNIKGVRKNEKDNNY